MKTLSKVEIIDYLKKNKEFFYKRFGVIKIGVFGSFARDEQTISSDIDMVVDIEKDRKNIHNFMQLKRLLENELNCKIDLGFEHVLKPIVKEKIKEQIIYV